jgi:hypothetical protein
MATTCYDGLLRLSRGTDERSCAQSIPQPGHRLLATRLTTPQSKGPNDLGDNGEIIHQPVAEGSHPASLAE